MRNTLILILLVAFALPTMPVHAADDVPRFESLRFSESRLRRGPGRDHRIDMLYQRRGLPLEVIDEYREWRRVRDRDGLTGWLHRSQLSPRRTAVVIAEQVELRAEPQAQAKIEALLEQGVVLRLDSCGAEWCAVRVDTIRGWSRRAGIWGVAEDETFDAP